MIQGELELADLGRVVLQYRHSAWAPYIVNGKKYSLAQLIELVDQFRVKRGAEPLRKKERVNGKRT